MTWLGLHMGIRRSQISENQDDGGGVDEPVVTPPVEDPVGLLADDVASFDNATEWSTEDRWSVADGVATNSGAATAQSLRHDVSIPAGDVLFSYKMVASNGTGGLNARFGNALYNTRDQRRDVGGHAFLIPAVGHSRVQLVAKSGWAGSIDDVQVYDISDVQSRPVDIYLLAGQSNMAGNAAQPVDPQLDTVDPRITYLASHDTARYGGNTTELTPAVDPLQHFSLVQGVGPGLSAAKGMLPTVGSTRRIVLVPGARGGTTLLGTGSNWEPGAGNCYLNLVAQANAALALCPPGSVIKGLFWSQGESDNTVNVGTTYPPAFQAFLGALRSDLASPNMPVVILGPTPEADTEGRLAAAQATLDETSGDANAVPGVRFVAGPAGYAMDGDEIHFSPAGNRIRGDAAAQAMRDILAAAPANAVRFSDETVTYNGQSATYQAP